MLALVMVEPSQGTDRTELQEVGMPRPGPGEVTIDVAYAGINFLDVMERRGEAGYVPAWPHHPGHEVAGTIRATGPGVDDLAVGQRVAALVDSGGLAEVARARAVLVVPVPDGVALPVAAAAPLMLATAMLLLTDAGRLRPGESVLVQSAGGGVGGALAQLVPILGGGPRIGTVGHAEKVATARNSGYDLAFVRDGGLADAVRAAVPAGVDLVLDPLGTTMLDVDLAVAAPVGRIVLFGNAAGGEPGGLPAIRRLQGGNLAIAGFSISRLAATAPRRVSSALGRVLDLIASGRLDVAVHQVGSLAEVSAVQQRLADRRSEGKYVVRVSPAA